MVPTFVKPLALLGLILLAGCGKPAPTGVSSPSAVGTPPQPRPGIEAPAPSTPEVDPEQASLKREIAFYIDKLKDREFTSTYGGEHQYTWYTAAEELGKIGKPAVPALVEKLASNDPYELKLALYALMLASQDPELKAETGGDYLQLGTVLEDDTNAENKALARAWWSKYRSLWPKQDASLPDRH